MCVASQLRERALCFSLSLSLCVCVSIRDERKKSQIRDSSDSWLFSLPNLLFISPSNFPDVFVKIPPFQAAGSIYILPPPDLPNQASVRIIGHGHSTIRSLFSTTVHSLSPTSQLTRHTTYTLSLPHTHRHSTK